MRDQRSPIPEADLSCRHFQYLEDLATAYWHSEVLFAALELRLFDRIEARSAGTSDLARQSRSHAAPLGRLLSALEALGLVRRHRGAWFNTPIARTHLLSDQPGYLGDFLLYRRYLQDPWRGLARRVAENPDDLGTTVSPEDGYLVRNRYYVQCLDALAARKAEEIFDALNKGLWSGPVLDVGGGAGALCRRAIHAAEAGFAVLLDLPEVLEAARRIHPEPAAWDRVHPVAADIRGAFPLPAEGAFGLVILSNVLHAYDASEARHLLQRAAGQLRPGGLLLIHDYFPDAPVHGAKGALYDLNMLLNTYDGRCHRSSDILAWLAACGLERSHRISLPSDSDLILAGGGPATTAAASQVDDLLWTAKRLGFLRAVPMAADAVVSAAWVQVKCRYGCERYGRGLTCPPHGGDAAETATLIRSYRTAILLEGEPPGDAFHRRLLALEKRAFLAGFHKALGFGAGPCTLCASCPEDGLCRFPGKARPSMEASGIDVYATARAAGIRLAPVARRGDHVKYFGLLLVE